MFGRKRKSIPECQLSSVWTSQTGLVRAENQDSVFSEREAGVFCVADGMGGGAEGAKASGIVCEHLRKELAAARGCGFPELCAAANGAIERAHAEIVAYSAASGIGKMGSTVVVLLFNPDGKHAMVGHVGDSRAYRIRKGFSECLTRDHTIGVEIGEFAGSQAAKFRDRSNKYAHILTRAIGVEGAMKVEWRPIETCGGDRYVICSDGVHDVVSDARLAIFAGGGKLESAQRRLTDEIVAKGAPDNFSFVIVEID